MRKGLLILLIVGLIGGCKKGDVGPSGPQGNPGAGLQTYTTSFLDGSFPFSSFTGTFVNTVDASNPTTASASTATLNFASTISSASRVLFYWPIKDYLPSNATVVAAQLQLILQTTSITQNKNIGAYQMLLSGFGANWSSTVTWNAPAPPGNPSWGPGPVTFTKGDDFSSSAMSTVTVKSTDTAGTKYAWSLSPSMVQTWINSNTNNAGVVLASSNEGTGETTGSVSFYPQTASGIYRPELVVQYTIP